ncbi:MAG: branched-chain amino acid ABC transporter permease [Anaerovoracaceae bacterium]
MYILTLVIIGCINVVAVGGMVLLTGYTGMFSMGHAGFMAVGGYAAALLYIHLHVPYVLALIAGGLIAAVSSIIIGYPTLKFKLSGDYFAIATLGFGEIVRLVLANTSQTSIFGGAMGIIGIPRLTNIVWALIFTVISVYFLRSFIKSEYGRNCIAVNQQEVAAEMIGVNIFKVKMTTLMISAFYCGFAGGMFAFFMTYISPVSFSSIKSTDLTAAVVMGGVNSISGPLLVGFILILLPELLRTLIEWRLVIYGLVFVGFMLFKPEGLMGYREFSPKGIYLGCKKMLSKVFLKKNSELNMEGSRKNE